MKKKKLRNFKIMNLNFGPQHPAAHGVLRVLLELKGEVIKKIDPHIGLLHRGTEKLIENKTYLQSIPYFDRLDYVSMMTQEHAFCLSIEKIGDMYVPYRGRILRVLFSEITRLLNHLLSITTHALDVGAMTPFLWGFEEREKLFNFYEQVSGARMHAAFFRPSGLAFDIPFNLLKDIKFFCLQFASRLDEIEEFLTTNRIWRLRLKNIGVVVKDFAKEWSLSGVMLRSSGVLFDLRKKESYEFYNHFNFKVPIGSKGDCFDRYLLRIEEMRQSLYIMEQAINIIPFGPVVSSKYKTNFMKQLFKYDMEKLIIHFKRFSTGFFLKSSSVYSAVESPKGEFGVYLKSTGTNKPYRCKIRAPGFFHLQALLSLSKNLFLSDLVTLIGTCDIVLGEIDR